MACRRKAAVSRIGHAPSSSSRRRALSDADRNAPAFGVYVHWPFCLSKCPYCDFNSHVRQGGIDETRYVAAYAAEIASSAARTGKRTVSTIIYGGGTPSLMQPATAAATPDTGAKHGTVADGGDGCGLHQRGRAAAEE